MLQATDAVDADALADKINRLLNACLGNEKKGRLTQRDHDAFERRSPTGSDNAGAIAGQIIDLSGCERGHRERAGHLNQLDFNPVLFKQTGVARHEEIQK